MIKAKQSAQLCPKKWVLDTVCTVLHILAVRVSMSEGPAGANYVSVGAGDDEANLHGVVAFGPYAGADAHPLADEGNARRPGDVGVFDGTGHDRVKVANSGRCARGWQIANYHSNYHQRLNERETLSFHHEHLLALE